MFPGKVGSVCPYLSLSDGLETLTGIPPAFILARRGEGTGRGEGETRGRGKGEEKEVIEWTTVIMGETE